MMTRSDGPSGKTWRFLVMTWFSADDVVEGNTIEQVGSRDDDTIPWSNEPEIILTEATASRRARIAAGAARPQLRSGSA